MKQYTFLVLCFFAATSLFGQRYMTQNGTIRFFSETPVENIEAVNQQVASVVDVASSSIAFTLLMKAFVFEKALMQEHFNEKYVHSDKFPKAIFKGQLEGFDPAVVGEEQEVTVRGKLTIHGVTQEVSAPGKISVSGTGMEATSTFTIKLADYDIEVPSAVVDNISETIEITVDLAYEAL